MKNVLILAAVAIAITTFAVFYLFGADEPTNQPVVEESAVTEASATTSKPLSGVSSLADLQSFGVNLECQITYQTLNDAETEGTLFLADGDIRADFLMDNIEFGEYAASIIVLPDYTYSWSQIEGSSYGIKIQTSSLKNDANGTEAGVPVTLNDSVRYTCEPWEVVDGSVFTPPATVLFKDAATIEAAGMEYGTIYEEELPY